MRSLIFECTLGLIILIILPLAAMGAWESQSSGVAVCLNGIRAFNDQTALIVGDDGTILRTENGGELWFSVPSGVSRDLMGVYFLDENYGWVCGSIGTILATTDGGQSWSPQTSGLTLPIAEICFADSLNGWACCGCLGLILHTTNGGITWDRQTLGWCEDFWSIRFVNDQVGWSVGSEGTIIATTNGGETWQRQMSGTGVQLMSIYCLNEDTAWIAGCYGTILETTNGGITWNPCSSGTVDWLWDVFFTDADHGWVVGSNQNIYATIDGGVQWTQQYAGVWPSGMRGISMINNSIGWTVGTGGTIMHTTNGGMLLDVTLTPLNPPVQIPPSGGSFDFNVVLENSAPDPATFDAWIMAQLPDLSWFGPVLGPVNITLPGMTTIDRDRSQNVPAGAPSGTYTYQGRVGNYPDEIWDSDSFTFEKPATSDGEPIEEWLNTGEDFLSDEVTSACLPSSFCLFPCHPNPFNPSTTISFSLPEASKVNLAVYDISGRLVTSLIDGYRQAGYHQLTFDGSNLASGVYLVKLETGTYNQVNKILLIR